MLTKPCFQTATSVDYDCVVYSVTRARLIHPCHLLNITYYIFLISLPSLKFTIFPLSFDFVIADILAVCRTLNANNLGISYHAPTCSVVRAPNRCTEDHGCDFCLEADFSSAPYPSHTEFYVLLIHFYITLIFVQSIKKLSFSAKPKLRFTPKSIPHQEQTILTFR